MVPSGMHPTGMMLPMVNWAFASINKLATVHAFGGDEKFLFDLVTIGIPEVNNGERSTTTRVMNDVFYNPLNVAISFGIVDRSESWGSFPMFRVRHEDRASSFTLSSYHTTHI